MGRGARRAGGRGKPPFAGPEHVLAYLGRYTHRVAISNDRLLAVADGRVRFRWRDYANGDRVKGMDLAVDEFLRRFLLHVVPDGSRTKDFTDDLAVWVMFYGPRGGEVPA